MRKPNLIQCVFFPIMSLILIMFLANWLRDLIILEWDITIYFASGIGLIITVFIAFLSSFSIYCIIRLNGFLTDLLRVTKDDAKVKELIEEFNRIKYS